MFYIKTTKQYFNGLLINCIKLGKIVNYNYSLLTAIDKKTSEILNYRK